MIFDSIMKQYSLHEDNTGDDDQQNTDNQDTNTTTDTTAGDNDEYTVNDPNTEGTDDADNTETQDNDQTDDQDTTDDDEYTINDPDEEGTTDDNQDNADDQDTTDDDEYSINDPDEEGNTDDDQDESTDDSDPSAKLKSLEKSIFDQLSPELQQSKTTELKKLYSDTYDKCQSIIDIISTADKQPDQVKIYDYILNSLIDLQKYIKDYLTNIFDSKTYIENMTELQKYLAILDTVNGVFEDMSKTSTGDDNK